MTRGAEDVGSAEVRVLPDGPYRVTGDATITDAEGRPVTTDAAATDLCRCGRSGSKPLCDDSHLLERFDGTETAPTATDAAERHKPSDDEGPPRIAPRRDGPYRLTGDVRVFGADGQEYETRGRRKLCRCGNSGSKPFCDGSHRGVGFRDPAPEAAATPPRSSGGTKRNA